MKKVVTKEMLKGITLYLIYFAYTLVATNLINNLHISNVSYIMLPADFIFLVFTIMLYKDNLRKDYISIKKKGLLKLLGKVLLGLFLLILSKGLMGMITDILYTDLPTDTNTSAIVDLFNNSFFYAFFKTLIFAPIAEEILFRESLRPFVKSNILFIIISALIYTLMNFIFSSTGSFILIDLLIYLVPALVLSYIYINNDNNIIIVMIIKFIMQFIPCIMLIV